MAALLKLVNLTGKEITVTCHGQTHIFAPADNVPAAYAQHDTETTVAQSSFGPVDIYGRGSWEVKNLPNISTQIDKDGSMTGYIVTPDVSAALYAMGTKREDIFAPGLNGQLLAQDGWEDERGNINCLVNMLTEDQQIASLFGPSRK